MIRCNPRLGLPVRLPLVLCVLIMLLSPAGGASAASRDELAEAARAFDEAALRIDDDNTKPVAPRKWLVPIKLAVRNPGKSPGLVAPALKAIRTIAEVAQVEVSEVDISDKGANFIVYFDENGTGNKNNCEALAQWKNWALTRAEIRINPGLTGLLDNCLIHEAMHAFGLYSHPHAADSVLSYVYKRSTLTSLDLNLIKTLYDPAMKIGTLPVPASVQACRKLGGLMSVGAADVQAVCDPRKRSERTTGGESFRWVTAVLKLTAGAAGTCAARPIYWVNLYSDKVSFSFTDSWRTFAPDASGTIGSSFTLQASGKAYDFKLAGNLKTKAIAIQNVTSGCAWEGTID